MDKAYWQQIEQLFYQALDKAEPERSRFLQAQCSGQPELLTAVSRLLAAEGETLNVDAVLQHEAADLLAPIDLSGDIVGRYKIVRELGRGGMGAVYLAERDDQQFTKQVAIKVSRTKLADPVLQQAFRTERQILADLEHAAISRLLDGGTTAQGMPYLVMEYVNGEPVDKYCNKHNLSQTARLQLFVKVINAVAYAHQNMVVHCDIKPSNILVTGNGEPKLLDFGIAQLLTRSGRDTASSGNAGLTFCYASPEQQQGKVPSALSDVYALGVTLHVLLCGTLPQHDSGINAALAEDLRCILQQAMQAKAALRYSSADALADDIKRFLGKHPVKARPDSYRYRCYTFIRRNTASSALAAVVLCAVAGFSVAFWQQAQQVRQERDLARVQRDKAVAISRFVSDMLSAVDPFTAQGQPPTVLQLLDQSSQSLEQNPQHALIQQPEVEAAVRQVIGRTYFSLGELRSAQSHLEQAKRLAEQHQFAATELYLSIITALVNVYKDQYRTAEVLSLSYLAFGLAGQLYGAGHINTLATLSDLASAYHTAGELAKAEQMWQRLYHERLNLLGPQHPDIVNSLTHLGIINHWLGRYDKAEQYYQQCLDKAAELMGIKHPATLQCMSVLGSLYETSGQYSEAEPLISRHVALAQQVLGARHPDTLRSQHNLADTYRGLGRLTEAAELFRTVLALRTEVLGSDNIETLQSRMKLARVMLLQHNATEAETLLTPVYSKMQAQLGNDHPSALTAGQLLADTYLAQHKYPQALTLYQQILQQRTAKQGNHPDSVDILAAMAQLYFQQNNNEAAMQMLQQAAQLAQQFPRKNFNRLQQIKATLTLNQIAI
jgi:serine/threonine-protein kinase